MDINGIPSIIQAVLPSFKVLNLMTILHAPVFSQIFQATNLVYMKH